MSPRAKVDLLVLFPEADVSMMHGHGVVVVCSVVVCCVGSEDYLKCSKVFT